MTVYDPLTWNHYWSYEVEERILASYGIDFAVPSNPEERDRLASAADVVVSSSLINIDAELIRSFANCVGILCYSSGMDAVDVEEAQHAGIRVSNVRANTTDVAEHALALLLALRRRILPMTAAAESGRWDLREFPEVWSIPRLEGQVAGIIGAGKVGQAIAARTRAFGMSTIACYHSPPDVPSSDLPHVELGQLMSSSDAIIVCASLNPDSAGLIDARALSLLKPGAVLVNVARGGLVDERALVAALDSGRLAGAALDVRDPEPPASDDPLRGRPNVIQTPHMAGASAQARADLHQLAARGIIDLLENTNRLPKTSRP